LDQIIFDIENFYEQSGMWKVDGIEKSIRQIRIEATADDERRIHFTSNYIQNKDLLDFGCGAGGYLLKAKEIAKSVTGIELEREKRDYLRNQGITCLKNVEILQHEKYDVITLFHVLEHLADPIDMLKKLGNHLSADGKMIIEVPNADDVLLSLYGSKAFADFTYWVCHLYLFTNKTLTELIHKAGLQISFIQQIQRYPLSSHLYWLSNGKPGGRRKWAALNDDALDKIYGDRLANLGVADTIIIVVEKGSS